MKWFRSNITSMARLALFALALQFLLSFGHFHGDGTQAASASSAAGTPGLAAHLNAPHKNTSPAHHAPDGQPADDCAICAVMALANAMMAGTAPVLSGPQATALTYLAAAADLIDRPALRLAFQPRGPPVA